MKIEHLDIEITIPLTLTASKVEQILEEEDVSPGDLEEETEVHEIVTNYIEQHSQALTGGEADVKAEVVG